MTKHTTIYTVVAAALAFSLTACNGGGREETDTDPTPGTTDTPTTMTGTTDVDPTTAGPTTVDPETTDAPETTDEPETTVDPTTMGEEPAEFDFFNDPYDAYVQYDRHGAVEAGTAGIKAASGLGLNGEDIAVRDAYNKSNPLEDSMGMWVPEIAESITFFHDAFDDDLEALGLVPATIDETVMQAGPVIIPDTIKYDPSMPTGYPNGRALTDQVVDITLAAVLLKLGPDQPLTAFTNPPLNPPANDVPFAAQFPYLAPPHKP